MNTYEAYGITIESIQWKDDSGKILMDLYLKDTENKETYHEYCEDNNLKPDDESSMEEFIEDYENETYCWCGREAILTDIINCTEFNGEDVFRTEDNAIFVPAYIPADKNSAIITREDIKDVLGKYISLIAEKPVEITWLTIHQ